MKNTFIRKEYIDNMKPDLLTTVIPLTQHGTCTNSTDRVIRLGIGRRKPRDSGLPHDGGVTHYERTTIKVTGIANIGGVRSIWQQVYALGSGGGWSWMTRDHSRVAHGRTAR